jgi:hypothetical protein
MIAKQGSEQGCQEVKDCVGPLSGRVAGSNDQCKLDPLALVYVLLVWLLWHRINALLLPASPGRLPCRGQRLDLVSRARRSW